MTGGDGGILKLYLTSFSILQDSILLIKCRDVVIWRWENLGEYAETLIN